MYKPLELVSHLMIVLKNVAELDQLIVLILNSLTVQEVARFSMDNAQQQTLLITIFIM